MWSSITKEEFQSLVGGLNVAESFSDPTGESPLGHGRPWMETKYGDEKGLVLKAISSKIDTEQPEWDHEYYKNIHADAR